MDPVPIRFAFWQALRAKFSYDDPIHLLHDMNRRLFTHIKEEGERLHGKMKEMLYKNRDKEMNVPYELLPINPNLVEYQVNHHHHHHCWET